MHVTSLEMSVIKVCNQIMSWLKKNKTLNKIHLNKNDNYHSYLHR